MDDMFLCVVLALLFLLLALNFCLRKCMQYRNLPPSPPALPIIGHLHLVNLPLHRSLDALSLKYGPIISLRFGSRRVMVISSPSAVEECLTTNDIVFANRPPLTIQKYVGYNNTTLATASYGDHWRNLRRISSLEVFSSSRLNAFKDIRRDEIKIFLKKLYSVSSHDFAKVELKPMLTELTFNIIMRMVAGKRYYGEEVAGKDKAEAEQFREMIAEVFAYAGASYLGDFLPFLKWIDYQGFVKRMMRLAKRTDRFLQNLIDEHRRDDKTRPERRKDTMIGHLISMQESQPEYYTDEVIKGLVLDIVFGGTESSAVTLEWAMSNLLNHPQVLEKGKDELDSHIGEESLMDESDISKLPYLQNIITETMRLHPAGPLLIPHLSSQECSVGGYHVEADTMLLVNVWAIHRDPEFWEDASEFKPERFESNAGQGSEAYKYLPFGLGRRSCPGMGLANRVVGFALGSMIQCFEWKRVSDQEIEMSEGRGLTMPKAEPLEALCKARNNMKNVLSSSFQS
ncbi:cytochrome P450 81Q32 [Manihot esculenta]|nr:cytochrome P450 81Q32 [Manihot esculenta]